LPQEIIWPIGSEHARGALADDDHRLGLRRVGELEQASPNQRNAQRRKETRPDVGAGQGREHLGLVGAAALNKDIGLEPVHVGARVRKRVGDRCRRDAGQCLESLEDTHVGVVQRSGRHLTCPLGPQHHSRRDHTAAPESRLAGLKLEKCLHQQRGADQQHHRQRDLCDDER
jgi:hypothetical protein